MFKRSFIILTAVLLLAATSAHSEAPSPPERTPPTAEQAEAPSPFELAPDGTLETTPAAACCLDCDAEFWACAAQCVVNCGGNQACEHACFDQCDEAFYDCAFGCVSCGGGAKTCNAQHPCPPGWDCINGWCTRFG